MFGELRYEGDYGWWGKQTLEFGGNLHTVDILIHDDGARARITNTGGDCGSAKHGAIGFHAW